jgi:hypothetical protein
MALSKNFLHLESHTLNYHNFTLAVLLKQGILSEGNIKGAAYSFVHMGDNDDSSFGLNTGLNYVALLSSLDFLVLNSETNGRILSNAFVDDIMSAKTKYCTALGSYKQLTVVVLTFHYQCLSRMNQLDLTRF